MGKLKVVVRPGASEAGILSWSTYNERMPGLGTDALANLGHAVEGLRNPRTAGAGPVLLFA